MKSVRRKNSEKKKAKKIPRTLKAVGVFFWHRLKQQQREAQPLLPAIVLECCL
jgi:pyridoxine/pyridoxamine 5'-phosphate oxidase